MIRLVLANFELVKCCLLYFSPLNNSNQMKAGSLFYLPGKNYRWPVKTVPLREFPVTHISLNYCAIVIVSFYFINTFPLNLLK